MVVQHNSKNEGDPIKNEGARVLTRIFVVVFFQVVSGGILPKFELIQVLELSSLPARMKKIQSKMKELEC